MTAEPTRQVRSQRDLIVYARAMDLAMRLFDLSRLFPREEVYSLTDQMRRSSRSVCANIAEAWRKRRYPAAFVAKLNDAESEAAETQTWIEFAVRCEYLNRDEGAGLYQEYEEVLRMLVAMINRPEVWTIQ